MEAVYVCVDDNPQIFWGFASKFSFVSMCDYIKLDHDISYADDVFGTLTVFLLSLGATNCLEADIY